ncbi:MAG: xanthine dehydrogenase family protein subunit M [Bacteroidia bacterium]|nr:xanthine dehydrogenase family protein subunit M [Bacteroidia bacterium]
MKKALALLEKSDNGAILAGGTDLLVELKTGLRFHKDIISLSNIKELKKIIKDENNLYIGAATTHKEIMTSRLIMKYIPSIAEAVSKIGSEQIRNTGTIGGNLCTGSSCCDSAPVLIALNAGVEIANSKFIKTVSLKDFFVFNKKTILGKGDIMTRVIIPIPAQGIGVHFEKFGLREAVSISVVSVAAMVKLKDNICIDACIVLGAVAPTPKISTKSADLLKGINISQVAENSKILEQVSQAAADDSMPIDDIRAGANYRREILKVLTKRAVLKAVENSNRN